MRLSFRVCAILATRVVSKQDLLVKGRSSSTSTAVGEEGARQRLCKSKQKKKKCFDKEPKTNYD